MKNKKILLFIFSFMMGCSMIIGGCANKNDEVKIESSDQEEFKEMDISDMQMSDKGIVIAPVTLLADTYGAKIEDKGDHAWILSYNGQELYIPISQNVVSYDGVDYTLNETNQMKDGLLYSDIRTLSEIIGYSLSVSVDEDNNFTYAVAIKNSEQKQQEKNDNVEEKKLDSTEKKYVRTDIYMRDAASALAQIIDVIEQYDCVIVTSEKGDWSGVDYNGQSGYIRSEYLTDQEPTADQQEELKKRTELESTTTIQGDKKSVLVFQDIENIYRTGQCAKNSTFNQKSMNYWGYINVSREMQDANGNPVWMYFGINSWYIPGQVNSESENLYNEMSTLTKSAFIACLGEDGNTLYDTLNELILRYGDTYAVPSQDTLQFATFFVKIDHSDTDGLQIFIY